MNLTPWRRHCTNAAEALIQSFPCPDGYEQAYSIEPEFREPKSLAATGTAKRGAAKIPWLMRIYWNSIGGKASNIQCPVTVYQSDFKQKSPSSIVESLMKLKLEAALAAMRDVQSNAEAHQV